MSWGDIDEKGKPIKRYAGESYTRWVNNVKKRGYDFDYRILNSADFGAYTSRKRFFGLFAKDGLPIIFPIPTYSKMGSNELFGKKQKWKQVKDVLNINDEGESIFTRKRPLVDATLERIYAGLIKFVAGGKDKWLLKYNSTNGTTRKRIHTSTPPPCQNRFDKTTISFLPKGFSGDPYSKNISINEPAGTITTRDHHYFLSAYYGNGHNHSINEPSPTLTTKDRLCFLDIQYGNGTPASINSPACTVTVNPKHCLVSCVKGRYIMNPQYKSPGGSINKPCFTLIARMDKMPPYLITTETGDIAIKIEENDTPAMIKIKEFMILYGIIDIKMRMLKIPELKQIMGFPKDYVLVGNKSEQKKFIGNAVEVNMSRALCEALCEKLN